MGREVRAGRMRGTTTGISRTAPWHDGRTETSSPSSGERLATSEGAAAMTDNPGWASPSSSSDDAPDQAAPDEVRGGSRPPSEGAQPGPGTDADRATAQGAGAPSGGGSPQDG